MAAPPFQATSYASDCFHPENQWSGKGSADQVVDEGADVGAFAAGDPEVHTLGVGCVALQAELTDAHQAGRALHLLPPPGRLVQPLALHLRMPAGLELCRALQTSTQGLKQVHDCDGDAR